MADPATRSTTMTSGIQIDMGQCRVCPTRIQSNRTKTSWFVASRSRRVRTIRSFAPGITRDNSGIRGMPTLASGLRISSQLGPVETIPQTHRGPHGLSMTKECEAGYRGHEWGSIQHSPYVRLPTCETGSLETAPSATQSRRCSHSGIALGFIAVFSLYLGRFQRPREERRRNKGRLG